MAFLIYGALQRKILRKMPPFHPHANAGHLLWCKSFGIRAAITRAESGQLTPRVSCCADQAVTVRYAERGVLPINGLA